MRSNGGWTRNVTPLQRQLPVSGVVTFVLSGSNARPSGTRCSASFAREAELLVLAMMPNGQNAHEVAAYDAK